MRNVRDLIARRRPTGSETADFDPDTARPGHPLDSNVHSFGSSVDKVSGALHPAPDAQMARTQEHFEASPFGAEAPAIPTVASEADTRPTVRPSTAPNRRKIWDLERPAPSQRHDDPPVRDADAAWAPTGSTGPRSGETEPAPRAEAGAVPEPIEERPKTRLLGFHGAGAGTDIFDQPADETRARGLDFPVGWLVVTDGPGKGASFTITVGLSTVGRSADQTVPLDFGDDSISREKHISIAYDEEDHCTYVGHGGKSNIVRLNDKPLLSTEELRSGDSIRIGKTTLRFVSFCDASFNWSGSDAVEPAHG